MEDKRIKMRFSVAVIIILLAMVTAVLCIYVVLNKNRQMYVEQNSSKEELVENKVIQNSENISPIFSDKEVEESLRKFYALMQSSSSIPVFLGLSEKEKDYNSGEYEDYIKTDVKYSDFEEKMLEYVTENYINKMKEDGTISEENGILLVEAGENESHLEIQEISRIDGTKYRAKLVKEDDSEEILNIEFGISNYKGKCVIEYKKVLESFVQFDTAFYDLKDGAIEYKECEKVENYQDFEYDLDGNGQKDKITIKNNKKSEDDENFYEIELDGKTFYKNEVEDQVSLYIVDLNENDKSIEVVIRISGPNDLVKYKIFSKKSSKMEEIFELDDGWNLSVDKKEKMVLDNALLVSIKPKICNLYYEFDNGKISKKISEIEKIKNITLKSEEGVCFTEDKNNLKRYQNANNFDDNYDMKSTLKKYEIYMEDEFRFKIIKFTDDFATGSIYVKLEDGRTGYLFSVAYNLAG